MNPRERHSVLPLRRQPSEVTRPFDWAFVWLPLIGTVAFIALAPFWLVRLVGWLIQM